MANKAKIKTVLSEFSVIMFSLSLIGIRISEKNSYGGLKPKFNLKSVIELLAEISLMLFAVSAVINGVFFIQYESSTLKLTSISLRTTLLILRCSLYSKKNQILKVIYKLQSFAKPQQQVLHSSERRYVILGCVLSFLLPAIVVVVSISFLMTDTEAHRGIYEKFFHIRNMSNRSKTLYGVLSSCLQTLFTLHYFVFPALIMTLLSFVYSSYSNILKHRLSDVRQDLLRDMTESTLSETLKILATARKIHSFVEDSVSFIAFLCYVLIFENILNLVSLFTNNFLSFSKLIRLMHCVNIFFWTTTWLIILTLCGSKIKRIKHFLKHLMQDIVPRQNNKWKPNGSKEMLHLLLLNECTKFNLQFTGWGMFLIDKKLFLSICSILITYGVLFATEL
ncbi:uncharacterized protein NPIL_483381 [Nephila pilipes]|uniref:Uncharacterized protein n=1 Tax=Nephila pilipes TaxID=299642 RepID=A0A8X6PXR9_NEPPI|nr:uncharacterized protein NPIL_483381 [Nephila pilipes]